LNAVGLALEGLRVAEIAVIELPDLGEVIKIVADKRGEMRQALCRYHHPVVPPKRTTGYSIKVSSPPTIETSW